MLGRAGLLLLCSVVALTGCDSVERALPDWMGGAKRVIKRAPGERIDVIFNQSRLQAEADVAGIAIEVPEQTNLPFWANRNDAMAVPHPGLTGIVNEDSVTIGEGNRFSHSRGPAPVVGGGLVVAMDAQGIISAHAEGKISNTVWTNTDGTSDTQPDLVGGGLAIVGDVLYATMGNGTVRALSLADGKLKWKTSVGAPVRGAPAADSMIVAVITADNQTLALDAQTGNIRWTHRGIREVASYVTTIAPVIADGVVVSAYSSGELFAIRAESGNVIWSDTLGSTVKTRASAIFSGIDADPLVQEGVVVAVSATGEIQASALLNGRPLWQKRVGSHTTPWSAGNAIFVLSDTHDLAALFKGNGSIRWATSLAQHDPRDATRDITPALYGPILAGNAVLVLNAHGTLSAFKPQDGSALNTYDLARDPVSAPIIANGALYYVTQNAKLYRYH